MFNKIKTSQRLRAVIFISVIIALVVVRIFFGSSKEISTKSTAGEIQKYCIQNEAVSKGKENCYSEEMKKIAEKKGPEFSFGVLNDLQMMDESSIGCHLIAHGIGWGSYTREPDNWRKLVQGMPTICNYGAIHGVIESYVLSLPNKSLSPEVIPTICGAEPRADCNHIIGHLLLVQTDALLDDALDLCGVFNNEIIQKRHCISGVFMEYQTALNLVDHDLVPRTWLNWPPRLPELEKICRSYAGEEASGCWEEIVHVALAKYNNDPHKIFNLCSSAQVKDGAQRCKRHSIGILGASQNFNLPNLKYICSIKQNDNDPNFENECYPNLISSALSTIPSKVPEAINFCKELDSEFKPACFSMIGGVGTVMPLVKGLLPESCKSAPPEYQDFCLGNKYQGSSGIIRSND